MRLNSKAGIQDERYQEMTMQTLGWLEDVLSLKKFLLMGKSLVLYFTDELTQAATSSKIPSLIEFRRNYFLCESYNDVPQPNPLRYKKKTVYRVQGMKISTYLWYIKFSAYIRYKFSILHITDLGFHVSSDAELTLYK